MFRRFLLLLLVVCTQIAGAAPATRQPAVTAAALVEKMFIEEGRAKEIAAELRRRAAAGEFDALSGQPLAEALTKAMHAVELDKHNNVRFNAEKASEPYVTVEQALAQLETMRTRGPVPPHGEEAERARKSNFGVKAVELLPGNVGYLRIDTFYDLPSSKETLTAAMQILGNTDAVIVDLRQNNGGNAASVAYLASYFLPADNRVLMRRRMRGVEAMDSRVMETPTRRFENVPLYVLTSDRTFSAGESFAYALQQYGRAAVVGETTAGGGRPNAFMSLGGGLQLSVSIGASEHPKSGKGWQGTGVVPEIVSSEEEAREAALRAAGTKLAGGIQVPAAVDALIAALNATPAEFEPFVQKHYAKSLLDQRTAEERAKFLDRLRGDFGKVSVVRPLESTPTRTVVEITGTTGITGKLMIDHDAGAQQFKMVQIARGR